MSDAPAPISSAGVPQFPQAQRPASGNSRRLPTLRVVLALILREMSTRYGRSPGGYIWALLEPLGGIMILSIGFSLIVRTPPLGNSFIIFFATGFVPFSLYQSLSNSVTQSISFSRKLLFYPAVTWVDAVAARFLLNLLTGIMVGYIVLIASIWVAEGGVTLKIGPAVTSMALAAAIGLGIGVLNCAITGLISTWGLVWSIINRPLFLASGVIFLYDDLPRMAQEILWYNPLMHVTGLMRSGFYPSYTAEYVSVTYCAGFAMITLALGVVLLGRYHRDILNNR